MNWYKRSQQKSVEQQYPNYGHIGHYNVNRKGYEQPTKKVFLWLAYADGTNFHKAEIHKENDSYDHSGLFYDSNTNMGRGVFQGRFDESKNIVSIYYDRQIFSVPFIPNKLINRLKKEFGQNIIILDYSLGNPKTII
jgi:hypothetical protein